MWSSSFCLCAGVAITNQVLNITSTQILTNYAIIGCSFNQSFYCVVCCSTDPSVPDCSVGYLSSTKGPSVSVILSNLGSNQMYYCKAAATNTTSANCGGPVVGGVKVFFSFSTPPQPSPSPSSSPSPSTPGTYFMECLGLEIIYLKKQSCLWGGVGSRGGGGRCMYQLAVQV